MDASVIIVDWGSSSFRAWLVEETSSRIVDRISEGRGMASLTSPEFPAYFSERLGPWREELTPPPVYMVGMVGAADGWQTAPQPPLPIAINDLANQMIAVKNVENAWIIPGARLAADPPDIMRGEEVQIFGALALNGCQEGLLCLPGTHSKWARVRGETLTDFTTSMTGELFATILNHTILGRGIAGKQEDDSVAFQHGLEQADKPGGLLHHLFTARTRMLSDRVPSNGLRSYVSGLLIGSEVRAMADKYPPDKGQLLLVSTACLRKAYETALTRAGYGCQWVDGGEATLRGVREVIRYHSEGTERR